MIRNSAHMSYLPNKKTPKKVDSYTDVRSGTLPDSPSEEAKESHPNEEKWTLRYTTKGKVVPVKQSSK